MGTLDAPDTHRLTAADVAGVFLPSVRSMGPGSADARTASEGGTRRAEASSEGGWLLWVRAGALVAQRLDVARAALIGDPVTLADAVVVDSNLSAVAMSVSASGLVAYRTGAGSPRQLTWVDRKGQALGPLSAPDEHDLRYPSVSPDGQRVAVARTVRTLMWKR